MNQSNTANTITTNQYQCGYCAYRLPCGICEKLEKQCPKQTCITYRTDGLLKTCSDSGLDTINQNSTTNQNPAFVYTAENK